MGLGITGLLQSVVFLPLALLPTIIAILKNHPQKIPIILVNVIGGLFWGIGWLVALVWCFITPKEMATRQGDAVMQNAAQDVAAQIEKLHDLQEKGALTREEFEAKKRELLEG